jgi:hypothetical protein
MRQASKRVPDSAEKTVRDIRRATRRHHSAEEKIRMMPLRRRAVRACARYGVLHFEQNTCAHTRSLFQ